MNRKIIAGIVGVLTLGGLTTLADAHHPEITVTSNCIDYNSSLVTITAYAWDHWDDGSPVDGDRRYNADVRVLLGTNEVGRGAFTPENNYRFNVTVTVPNTEKFLQARVTAVGPWGVNGQYEDDGQARTAFVRLPEDCGPVPTVPGSIPTTTRNAGVIIEREFERPTPATPIERNPKFTG